MEAPARIVNEGGRSDGAAALRALVDDDRVHRDVYTDPAVHARELRTFWAHTWQYLAHASQVPMPGDVVTVDLAGRPLMLVRTGDGALRVLANRCAHKGTKLVDEERANVGRHFRCPYHAWTYTLDGAPLGMFNLLTCTLPMTAGRVRFLGRDISGRPQKEVARMLSVVRSVIQRMPFADVLDAVAR